MGITSIDLVAGQAAAAVRNAAAGASASARSELSITRKAAELTGRVMKTAGEGSARNRRRRARAGVYVVPEGETVEATAHTAAPFTAPDGYVRRTPVQGVVTIPHYRARIVRRAISAVFLVALAVTAVWVLIRYNIFRI